MRIPLTPLIRRSFVVPALVLLGFAPVAAQEAEEPPAMTRAERIQSVENLKQHIAMREQRFESLRQELLALDERTESQIDYIVEMLASLRDSRDSRTNVANLKTEVMDSLMRSITIYRRNRMDVFERMRSERAVPLEELERTLERFDERIGKRIDQVTQLALSFPGSETVDKYESFGTSYFNGWSRESVRISEDWRQNQRVDRSGRQARGDTLEQINDALRRNEVRRAGIADALANRQLPEQERAVQEEELGRIDALIDHLRSQRRELALPGYGGAREIGRGEAHDVAHMLDDARRDLTRDFNDIMRRYSELEVERTRLFALKNNLAAREQWLKDNPPAEGEEEG